MRLQRGWPNAGVPSVEQVAREVAHIGAVARAHECLGTRRLEVERARVVAAAAVGIAEGTAAVAIHVCIVHGFARLPAPAAFGVPKDWSPSEVNSPSRCARCFSRAARVMTFGAPKVWGVASSC